MSPNNNITNAPMCSLVQNRHYTKNSALRLTTGSFKSTPIKSLHAECNIALLDLPYDLCCARYHMKTKEIGGQSHARMV